MIRKVSVLVAALALLSGCAMTNEAGTAAIVGDQRLSNDVLLQQHQDVLGNLGQQQAPGTGTDINRRLISSFVYSYVSTLAAERLGVAATDAQVEAKYQELLKSFGDKESLINAAAAAVIPPQNILRTLRTNENFAAIGKKLAPSGTADEQSTAALAAMQKVGNELGITISPRYGAWDQTTFAMSEDTSISLTLEQMFPAQPTP